MSLTQKVLALIAGISDPRIRVDVMSTVNFLFDLYCSNRIDVDQLRSDLSEICFSVISLTCPELTEDEVAGRVNVVVDDLIKTMRVEGLRRRTMYRFRTLFPV